MRILVDFKNWGEAEVFKHEDPSVQSLSYLENGAYLYWYVKELLVGCIIVIVTTLQKNSQWNSRIMFKLRVNNGEDKVYTISSKSSTTGMEMP